MLRVRQFLALARLTAVDTIRQPICLLLTVTCVLLTAATPLAVMHKFGEDGKLARDSGLAFHFVFGLFIAGYAAGSTLSRELRGGTASAVLSKPVGRGTLFFAKYSGIACVLLLFSTCAALSTLLGERIDMHFVATSRFTGQVTDWLTGNLLFAAPFVAMLLAGLVGYLGRRPFRSTAFTFLLLSLLVVFVVSGCFDRTGTWAPFDYRVEWRILPASILVTLGLLVLAAIAVSLSTRLATVPTLTLCGGVFMIGLMSDYLFGARAATSKLAGVLYMVIPNWQHFWLTDALIDGGHIPAAYVLGAAGYALTYAAGVLCLGLFSFLHAEVN